MGRNEPSQEESTGRGLLPTASLVFGVIAILLGLLSMAGHEARPRDDAQWRAFQLRQYVMPTVWWSAALLSTGFAFFVDVARARDPRAEPRAGRSLRILLAAALALIVVALLWSRWSASFITWARS